MWLGVGYVIPMQGYRNLSSPVPPVTGNFMALQSDINDIVLLEDGGKIELE
tara:strand:- start:6458 stop:6610 length:153 start_codon:yes stop_codon:yes gene_type:complete